MAAGAAAAVAAAVLGAAAAAAAAAGADFVSLCEQQMQALWGTWAALLIRPLSSSLSSG